MTVGIIDVGGGLRDIYGAGVFDGLLDMGIEIKNAVGISAGSANIVSYIAKQRGRNYRFFTDYAFRKEYMSFDNLIRKGSFIDFNYIYGTLSDSDGEDPLDYDEIKKFDGVFKIQATDALNGSAKFFDIKEVTQDSYSYFGASCCIPVVNKPVVIDGRPYFDGGVTLPVPIDYVFDELHWDKAIVILTLPEDHIKTGGIDEKTGFLIKKYPVIADQLVTRAQRYNRQVKKAKSLAKEGRVLIVAPDDTCGIDTLSKSKEGLDALYNKGVKDANKIREFLSR